MISRGEVRFNCCESTLMRIDEAHRLPGFDVNVMRIASNFGGGVAGWGGVCGAVSGAAIALGLVYGTSGYEAEKEFSEKRRRMRALTQELMSGARSTVMTSLGVIRGLLRGRRNTTR
jgi:C_GCAxxG_C_C family probable redox protein